MPAKGRVSIARALCKSCGFCVAHCPSGALQLAQSFNDKGFHPAEATGEPCSGCGNCGVMCPEAAIEVWRA